jgi:hypothetical protein
MNEITAIRPLTDEQAVDLVSASTLLELQESILDVARSRHGRQMRRRRTVALRAGRVQRWVASGAVAAGALAAALVVSLSGHAPNVAQAFPVLKGSATITPSQLQSSLRIYGVGRGNDGLDIEHGRPVRTRWGTGYVLTNPSQTTICFVAPGLNSQDWGASCADRSRATAAGTIGHTWAYDLATHAARFIQLFPTGAVVTIRAGDSGPRNASLDHGVLAINVSRPEQIAITIAHHTTTEQVTPKNATPTYPTGSGSSSSTSTTVTGTPTTPNS